VPVSAQRIERTILIGLVVVASSLLAAIKLADIVRGDGSGLDERVLRAFRSSDDLAHPLGPRWLAEMVRDVTALGSTGVLAIVVAAVAGFLLLTSKTHTALLVVISVLAGVLISQTLKFVVARPRPELVPHGTEVFTASFPSGHAMMAAVVYLTLGALLARSQPDKGVKIYVLSTAVILTGLVGLSRIYLGVHWPTDVLAGWALGGLWALISWMAMLWLQREGRVESERAGSPPQ
jgi:undecaprenyl-diphosphatase